ncbi:MAG TPA: hypothetical protein PLN56_08310 [Methanoregulaceae archaeon]|nr:hypothetical protein [Methanoregulaceae archaeon]
MKPSTAGTGTAVLVAPLVALALLAITAFAADSLTITGEISSAPARWQPLLVLRLPAPFSSLLRSRTSPRAPSRHRPGTSTTTG